MLLGFGVYQASVDKATEAIPGVSDPVCRQFCNGCGGSCCPYETCGAIYHLSQTTGPVMPKDSPGQEGPLTHDSTLYALHPMGGRVYLSVARSGTGLGSSCSQEPSGLDEEHGAAQPTQWQLD